MFKTNMVFQHCKYFSCRGAVGVAAVFFSSGSKQFYLGQGSCLNIRCHQILGQVLRSNEPTAKHTSNYLGLGAVFHSEESVHVTAKQAGQVCALCTALSTCIGILHAWCMPCTRSVRNPEQPEQAMEGVMNDMNGNHNKWSSCAWCKPVLASRNVPTNGFVCKRLASQQAGSVHGTPDQSVWKV